MMSGHLGRMVSRVQMISETGNFSKNRPSKGFSLIEIVLVLGLVALAVAMMVTNLATLADRGEALTAEETLFAAVRKARLVAARDRTIVKLGFDKEVNSLQISSQNGEPELFPLDDSFKENRSAEIRFFLIPASRGLAHPADPERADLETKAVEFAADRSASSFVVEIDLGSGTPVRLQFDPFSSLQVTSK